MKYSFMYRHLGTINTSLLERLRELAFNSTYGVGYFSPEVILQVFLDPQLPEIQDLTKERCLTFFDPSNLVGVEIDKMLPRTYLREHSDLVAYSDESKDAVHTFHKIHVPLQTYVGCALMWRYRPEALLPQAGNVYLINNVDIHSAVNLSDHPRYHLILKYRRATRIL